MLDDGGPICLNKGQLKYNIRYYLIYYGILTFSKIIGIGFRDTIIHQIMGSRLNCVTNVMA